MSELKHCPFCGDDNVFIVEDETTFYIECQKCGVEVSNYQHEISYKNETIKIWNSRPELNSSDDIAGIRKMIEDIHRKLNSTTSIPFSKTWISEDCHKSEINKLYQIIEKQKQELEIVYKDRDTLVQCISKQDDRIMSLNALVAKEEVSAGRWREKFYNIEGELNRARVDLHNLQTVGSNRSESEINKLYQIIDAGQIYSLQKQIESLNQDIKDLMGTHAKVVDDKNKLIIDLKNKISKL